MRYLLSIVLLSSLIFAQDIDDIKKSNNYIWGEGASRTLRKADKLAINDLISQISVQVESQFTDILTEDDGNLSEYTKSMLTTYSNTTLNRAERKVEEKRGKTTVLRYIRKENLDDIFKDRQRKIIDYTKSAISAEQELRIGDALKYYYWALVLLRSHPDHNSISMPFPEEGDRILLTAIPDRINRIFTFLDVTPKKILEDTRINRQSVQLNFRFQNQPVQNLDFLYWTGDSWTKLNGVKDGLGIAEFYGTGDIKKLRLKIEYLYENKSKIDTELWQVLDSMNDIPFFTKADRSINLKKEEIKEQEETDPEEVSVTALNNTTESTGSVEEVICKVIKGIEQEDYFSVQHCFTDEGYNMFDRLISYGKARLVDQPLDLELIQLDDNTVIRSLKMKFDFPNNDRYFIEDVNFVLNKENKISAINFGLGNLAIQDIINKPEKFGSLEEKYHLINFMENYKTAYCLERLDYIESIFSDNALIIVGSVVQQKENIGEMYNVLGGDRVKYLRMTKQEYVERLSHIFRANEYVNIHFEENQVKKVSGDKKIYGIQIKQNYYSTTYADEGYLFLMFDLSDTTQPKIYVRTWQPEKNPDGSIYGLSDFHF